MIELVLRPKRQETLHAEVNGVARQYRRQRPPKVALHEISTMMTRRDVLGTLGVLAATLGPVAGWLPANKNVKWGLGSNLGIPSED